MEFKCSDRHKRAMNFIYQRPVYPEVWDEEEVRRGAVIGAVRATRAPTRREGSTPSPAAKPKLRLPDLF